MGRLGRASVSPFEGSAVLVAAVRERDGERFTLGSQAETTNRERPMSM
jgi:hypothetical protein